MLEPDDAPHEPAEPDPEPDPEASLPDPERDLPSVPSVRTPNTPMPESEVPSDLLKEFWATVLLANLALLGLSAGVMALVFVEDRQVAFALLGVGAISAILGYRRYRRAANAQQARTE